MSFFSELRESYREFTKEITWPTNQEVQNLTILVAIATVIFALIVMVFDLGIEQIISIINNI